MIAATHDLELVSLLPAYEVVHFADQLDAAGLHFDYRLRPGATSTRNAIALLGVLGAPPEVVAEALDRTKWLRGVSALATEPSGIGSRATPAKEQGLT